MPTSSERTAALSIAIRKFLEERVYPAEKTYAAPLNPAPTRWSPPPIMDELKQAARAAGLWNLFLPESELGAGLTNAENATLCELMGRSPIASEAFNCSAPDTGNMEVLVRYGTPAHQDRWLK